MTVIEGPSPNGRATITLPPVIEEEPGIPGLTPDGGPDRESGGPDRDEGSFAIVADNVRAFITRYVALGEQEADALTLWVIHSHAFAASETTPYIAITSAGPGTGKGHPDGTHVLTPVGWRQVQTLRVGEEVIGRDGCATRIRGVFGRGELPVYRVTFNDGSSVLTDEDHLWLADPHGSGGDRVISTVEIATSLHRRWSIPVCAPVQFATRQLPIDPYVLGVLLGDGYYRKSEVCFSVAHDSRHIPDEIERRLPAGYYLNETRGASSTSYRITRGAPGSYHALLASLRELGIEDQRAHQKRIPEVYLFADESQRRDLLAGLMDTDGELGTARGYTATGFSSASEVLRDQVKFLVESLGGVGRKGRKATTTYTYRGERRTGRPSYRLSINVPVDPFGVRIGWAPHPHYIPRRVVRSVMPEGSAHVTCLQVEADDNLYLTEHCIVTHNTRALETLELLVANPWLTGRVTGPALVRKVAAERPTLLLDETDALFSGHVRSQEVLRGVLNSGYKLGGKASYAQGGGYVDLDVYCPKAFAGIGALPGTIADRSVPIVMRKRTAFQPVERLRRRDVRAEARVPRMLAARFAATQLDALRNARPDIPGALDDRAADVWEPLLAIADALGGSWPGRARVAAVGLCAGRKESDTESQAFELLSACRVVFDELEADRLQTSTLLEWLTEEGREVEGQLLDARLLADLLRGFGVCPKKIRFGRTVLQGYARADFEPAWALVADVPGVVSVPGDGE